MIQIPGKGLLLGVAHCDSRRSSNGSWKFRAGARVSNKERKEEKLETPKEKGSSFKILVLSAGKGWAAASQECTVYPGISRSCCKQWFKAGSPFPPPAASLGL